MIPSIAASVITQNNKRMSNNPPMSCCGGNAKTNTETQKQSNLNNAYVYNRSGVGNSRSGLKDTEQSSK